jgi:hypothetical protein
MSMLAAGTKGDKIIAEIAARDMVNASNFLRQIAGAALTAHNP